MTPSKYEFSGETIIDDSGRLLHRIRATRDFETELKPIKVGDLGGFVQHRENLTPFDNSWIHDNARVVDEAKILKNVKFTTTL